VLKCLQIDYKKEPHYNHTNLTADGCAYRKCHCDVQSWAQAARPYDMLRYDTRRYFNVRSKADMSQHNLPHGTNNKKWKTEKLKSKKTDMLRTSEVSVNSPGNPWSQSGRRKEKLR